MKKTVYILLFLILGQAAFAASPKKTHVIGFYNVENLFDTVHDEGKNDYEYLPDGANKWTEETYAKKLGNMASVIRAMKEENGAYHAVLGIAEVENRRAIGDLVARPEISDAGFDYILYDGPDTRGIDVALLYRPEVFKPLHSKSIPYTFGGTVDVTMTQEEKDAFVTRDILMVRGLLDGEMFAFFVAHLPSRVGGKANDLRSRGAEIIYGESMRLMKEFPGIKIVVMGDMNDNPSDDSMAVYMHGKETVAEVGKDDFLSPFISVLKGGQGTLSYRGEWNIYDIILANSNLVNAPKGTLGIVKDNKTGYYGYIFNRPFMTQQEGEYKGTPFRTFSGGKFIGGYSDHYPTFIIVGTK